MKKRKLFVILIICGNFLSNINGQTIPLVPHKYQKDNLWCWAASIEMIAKYNSINNKDQCKIARSILSNCCSCPTTDCTTSACNGNICSRAIYDSDAYSIIRNYIKLNATFVAGDFINWDNVVNQVTNRTPFILGVDEPSLVRCRPYHFVVGKGVSIVTQGVVTSKIILVNDPYCSGMTLTEVNYIESLKRPCSYIYNIKKPVGVIPMMFIAPQIKLDSAEKICEPEFASSFTDSELKKLIDSTKYKMIPVDYCEYDSLKILQKCGEALDIVNHSKCDGKTFVTRFTKVEDTWHPIFSFTQDDEPEIPIKAFGKSYILDNQKGNDTSNFYLPYRKVIFRPQPFEFYKFSLTTNKEMKSVAFTPAYIKNKIRIGNTTINKGEVLLRKNFIKIVKERFYSKPIKS
jgi:hypothetical protein